MQINQLRGLLYEFGADLPQGRIKEMARVVEELGQLESRLSAMVIDAIRQQVRRIEGMNQDIVEIEKKLLLWKKENEAGKKLMDIRCVGLLTATAAVATMGDAKTFKSGREFAAFLGLVPRQSGTGGRVKLLGISKRGRCVSTDIADPRCTIGDPASEKESTMAGKIAIATAS